MLHQVCERVHKGALTSERFFNFIAEVLIGLFFCLAHTEFVSKPVKIFFSCELQPQNINKKIVGYGVSDIVGKTHRNKTPRVAVKKKKKTDGPLEAHSKS